MIEELVTKYWGFIAWCIGSVVAFGLWAFRMNTKWTQMEDTMKDNSDRLGIVEGRQDRSEEFTTAIRVQLSQIQTDILWIKNKLQ